MRLSALQGQPQALASPGSPAGARQLRLGPVRAVHSERGEPACCSRRNAVSMRRGTVDQRATRGRCRASTAGRRAAQPVEHGAEGRAEREALGLTPQQLEGWPGAGPSRRAAGSPLSRGRGSCRDSSPESAASSAVASAGSRSPSPRARCAIPGAAPRARARRRWSATRRGVPVVDDPLGASAGAELPVSSRSGRDLPPELQPRHVSRRPRRQRHRARHRVPRRSPQADRSRAPEPAGTPRATGTPSNAYTVVPPEEDVLDAIVASKTGSSRPREASEVRVTRRDRSRPRAGQSRGANGTSPIRGRSRCPQAPAVYPAAPPLPVCAGHAMSIVPQQRQKAFAVRGCSPPSSSRRRSRPRRAGRPHRHRQTPLLRLISVTSKRDSGVIARARGRRIWLHEQTRS